MLNRTPLVIFLRLQKILHHNPQARWHVRGWLDKALMQVCYMIRSILVRMWSALAIEAEAVKSFLRTQHTLILRTSTYEVGNAIKSRPELH